MREGCAALPFVNKYSQPLPTKCFPTAISEEICTRFYSDFTQSHMWLGNRSRGSLGNREEFAHWHEWISG